MRRKALLAASFVVTTGLGCTKSSDPEPIHANPPALPPSTQSAPTPTTPPSESVTAVTNDNPPGPNQHVVQMPDGKCLLVSTVMCPKGVMCNPPPPREVPCPPDAGK